MPHSGHSRPQFMAGAPRFKMFDTWTDHERALAAEGMEARAYAALLGPTAVQNSATWARAFAMRTPLDSKSTLLNRVIGLGLDAPIDTETLQSVDKFFAPTHAPWSLELPPACATPDTLALLKSHRYRRSALSTAMLAFDCAGLPAPRAGVDVRRLDAGPSVHAADIETAVFGVSAHVRGLLVEAGARPGFRQWLAFDGSTKQPVAACLSYVEGEGAWFGWSATLASHRGRGLQSALLAACLHDAAAAGCRWLSAETSVGTQALPDASHRNMLRLGFVELYRRHSYLHMPRRPA